MHEILPVLLAIPLLPVLVWSGWTGFRMSLNPALSALAPR